jgi:peroxiredoxin
MKIYILFFLTCFLSNQFLTAQNDHTTQYFLIKGKIKNAKEASWNFRESNFLENKQIIIKIESDGTFKQLVPVEGMQDLYLYLNNDAITIYVQPDDTIEVNWDEENFKKSFEVKSPRPFRNEDLQLNLKLYNEFRQAKLSIPQKLWEEKDKESSLKFKWINDQFNQELKVVFNDGNYFNQTTPKFINQIYFFYTNLLLENRLLDRYSLIPDLTILNPNNLPLIKSQISESFRYKILDDALFYQCPEYRDFLFDYIRSPNRLFSGTTIQEYNPSISAKGDTLQVTPPYFCTKYYDKNNEVTTSSFALEDYYQGLSQINLISIRDWFVTKAIFFGFEYYSFEDAENALIDFLPKCKSKVYKDTLASYYSFIKKFKKGSPAPEFTLKDDKGNSVSLSDFKGKIVYLDFWGIGCPPCRYDIKNYVPKLHKKYHDKDIVFINICVDDEASWKKILPEINLDGVNLLAEGGVNNPVCKDYNIIGIPHYMLIDKNGRFVNSIAPGPGTLIDNQKNTIDELLTDK